MWKVPPIGVPPASNLISAVGSVNTSFCIETTELLNTGNLLKAVEIDSKSYAHNTEQGNRNCVAKSYILEF